VLIGRWVRLRRAVPADAELAATWFSDPGYLGAFYNLWPRTAGDLERSFEKELDRDTEGFFFIVPADSDEAVGTAGYLPYSVAWLRGLELWWHVHPSARRQGFATQAACLLVNHLFDATPIERLQATVIVGNGVSSRVAEHAGMKLEGVHRGAYFLHGSYADMNLYSIVRGDWRDEKTYRAGRAPF
jgi:ribosomal-protein-alanine N-acetyltransferase